MRYTILVVLLLILLAGCLPAPVVPPTPTATIPTPTETSTVTPTPTLTPTATPIPTATPFQDPMSIEYMRAQNYPGSDIVIESELERGANYQRYYASYMSEGLKIYALLK